MDELQSVFWADIGSNLGMFSVVVAAMNRQVVAVDADAHNLAYIRKSLDLGGNADHVRLIYNSVRWEITKFPIHIHFVVVVTSRTIMKTADQVREENITIVLVNKKNVSFQLSRNDSSSPPCSQSWWETLWILSRAGRSYWRLISKDMSARFGRFLTGTNLKPLYRLFNRIFFTTKLGNSFPTSSLSGFTSHRIRIPVPTSPSGSQTLCLVDTSQSTQVKSVWNESCQ